ncbi:MAG TPA: solute carrier family 23 protein [Thermoanaerobaculia bacterium]|jgi:xanthine/uracil permease|nr:solute carrier family 23 protein [Thermoanaerobaculia bacterium]
MESPPQVAAILLPLTAAPKGARVTGIDLAPATLQPVTGADRDDARVWDEDLEVAAPVYGVDDVPPPLETLLYAWQHTLVDVSPYVLPMVVAGAVGYGAAQTAAMISACLVLMGLATFANATWGNRLPSVLGPSATDTGAMATAGAIFGGPAMWMAGFLGGLLEIAIGISGVLARLRRFLPPYVCGIIVVTIGATLARVAGGWLFADPRPRMLALAGAAVVAVLALTVAGHLLGVGLIARGAILWSLLLCGVLGAVLLGLADFAAVGRAPWLGLPRPFAFGAPAWGWELVPAAVVGVAIGYLGSIAESIGDYAGTCAVAGIPYRVRHMNRGITVEGIASAVGPLFGALPLTTYAQNIGVIATTRVASRRVVQVAALLLLLYGLSPKLGALLVLIPRPVVGAVFLVICGMIAATGLRLLACGEKDETFYLTTAVSLAGALTLPLVAPAQKEWFATLPPLVRLMLSNGVVLAITLGVTLNGTLGTLLRRRASP